MITALPRPLRDYFDRTCLKTEIGLASVIVFFGEHDVIEFSNSFFPANEPPGWMGKIKSLVNPAWARNRG